MRNIIFLSFLTATSFGFIHNQKESSFVCPRPNGIFVHEDCAKFWLCQNNNAQEIDCPKSLLFNPRYEVCDWYLNVVCNEFTPTTPNDTASSTTISSATTILTSTLSTTRITQTTESGEIITSSDEVTVPDEVTTPEELTTDPLTTQTTQTSPKPTIPSNQCLGSHNLVGHEDCRKFWWHFEGMSREIDCDPGLAWNDLSKRCDEKSFSNCIDSGEHRSKVLIYQKSI